jgi:hypothetical protein
MTGTPALPPLILRGVRTIAVDVPMARPLGTSAIVLHGSQRRAEFPPPEFRSCNPDVVRVRRPDCVKMQRIGRDVMGSGWWRAVRLSADVINDRRLYWGL